MTTLNFQVTPVAGAAFQADVAFHNLVVAGWAGRDLAAIEHHIEELAELGVPRPSSVPLYYRVAVNQCTQASRVQVVGQESSGEIEVFVFQHQGQWLVSIASDHTDRKLEAHSVAMSKQVCIKPVATTAWLLEDVKAHWDQIVLRSWIDENGTRTLYQEGPLASLRTPDDLVAGYLKSLDAAQWPAGTGMTCGTVGAIGGIRAAGNLEMELFDPVLKRSLTWNYQVECLPDVA